MNSATSLFLPKPDRSVIDFDNQFPGPRRRGTVVTVLSLSDSRKRAFLEGRSWSPATAFLPLTRQGVKDLSFIGPKSRRNQAPVKLPPVCCDHPSVTESSVQGEKGQTYLIDVCDVCDCPRLSERDPVRDMDFEDVPAEAWALM